MRFIKLHGMKLIIPLALIAGFVAGSFSYGAIPATASATPDQSIQDIKPTPKFPVNKNGETYGSNSEVTVAGQEPDLILAKGVDGNDGYIKLKDLNKDQPNNPEEAVAYMEKMKNSAPKNIPLYDVDGKTVIGEFKIDKPEKVEITNETMNVFNR
jgi:hypothetical protein